MRLKSKFHDDESRIWFGNFSMEESTTARVYVLANHVVTAFQKRIYKVGLPENPKPELFRLRWPMSQPFSYDRVTKVKIESVGGGGELRFGLKSEISGLQIDQQTGELTIDGPVLWNSNIRRIDEHERLLEPSFRGSATHAWKKRFRAN
jgi:hypothetical protein